MKFHLQDPQQNNGPACGERQEGEALTRWRRFANCKTCLTLTAPRPLDKMQQHHFAADYPYPIRMTALAVYLRRIGAEHAAQELEREAKIAGAYCAQCRRVLEDPVVIVDARQNRSLYGCPFCAELVVRERWRREGLALHS